MDTVRIPISLLPYENPSASYQRELKAQRREQAATGVSEVGAEDDTSVKAVSNNDEQEAGKDSVSQASASAGTSAAEEAATATKTAQDTTAPSSESLEKK